MSRQLRVEFSLLASLALCVASASTVLGQAPGMITGFEVSGSPSEVTNPTGYFSGTVGPPNFQDSWVGTGTHPRVMTKTEIEAELNAVSLNPAGAVHSGDQALLVVKPATTTETTGYFDADLIMGLETTKKVTVNWWARPLTSGAGADPSGTPAGTGQIIGERQGNIFMGISDSVGSAVRAAAIRFGVDTVGSNPYTNVVERHIDFASASAGAAVWVKSGALWTADTWYNFRMDLDYDAKKYDFYINDIKINPDPIRFYTETSTAAQRFFVSRGTNQAGMIVDDVAVTAQTPVPPDVNPPGDFNHDHFVDGDDFVLWQQDNSVGSLADWRANFGPGPHLQAAISAIPEPASAVLMAGAILLGIGARRHRSR